MESPTLLTVGHGYAAAALAASLGPAWRRIGTVRSDQKSVVLRASGVEPVIWDDAEAVDAAIHAATHILVSIPPGEEGDPALLRHHAALKSAPRLEWVGYLSTTGVYGDRQGGWVDETSDLAPVNARSARRVNAERAWIATGLPVHIFRLAGIYGPGRSALERLRAGRAQRIIKPGQYFSRIHREDITQVLRASLAHPAPGRAYNLADDEPAPPQDVIAYAADLLGLPCPPDIAFEDADLSPMARSFYAESKRVSNARIKEELGVALHFPDYRAGLAGILAAEENGTG
ncbi:SDR family oxidoreductase [Amaricoccus macauensis]|uniref:SDR family oxidoreductase n=1 Tax=Amaricoccus macauensis TaxID=57001 RepID=UPI003C7EC42E